MSRGASSVKYLELIIKTCYYSIKTVLWKVIGIDQRLVCVCVCASERGVCVCVWGGGGGAVKQTEYEVD